MRYFAYGSNMDWRQMQQRCPTARFVAVGVARGYRLAFTRHSPRRCCGVADMIVDARSEVWGAIFEIGARHWRLPPAYIQQLERIEVA